MTKRITSIVLAVVMLLSVMAVGVVNVSAAGPDAQYIESPNGYAIDIGGSWPFLDDSGNMKRIPATYNGKPVSIVNTCKVRAEEIVIPGSIKYVRSLNAETNVIKRIIFEEGVERINDLNLGYNANEKKEVILPSTLKLIDSGSWRSIQNYSTNKPTLPDGCAFATYESYNNISGKNVQNFKSEKEYIEIDGVKYVIAIMRDTGDRYPVDYDGYVISLDNDYYKQHIDEVPSEITIPSQINNIPVIAIGYGGFSNKSSYYLSQQYKIEQINMPNTLLYIGQSAFENDRLLKKIIIPDSVVSIGAYAFKDDPDSNGSRDKRLLHMIQLGAGLKEIGDGAFESRIGCLNNIQLPQGLEYIGSNAFYHVGVGIPQNEYTVTTGRTYDISEEIPMNRNTISGYGRSLTLDTTRSFRDLIIPESVKVICEGAFRGLGSINSISYSIKKLEYLDPLAFDGTTTKNLTITDTVEDTPPIYALPIRNANVVVNTKMTNKEMISFAKTNNFTLVTDGIIESGGSANTKVTLTTTPANLRVTVPTVLPVSVDSDNNVTVSDNAKIVNNSNGQVDVTNAVLSGNNSWTLAAFDTDFKKVPVDTKQYGFKLQGYSVPVSGNAYNSQFDTIDGGAALDLSYDANVAIQSEAISDAEIGNIVFTVAWHK